MSRRIVIARHGDTFAPGEPPRRIGRGTDLPLVDSGRRQATLLGRHLAERGAAFDTVLAGPLLRTRESAALILSAFHAPPACGSADWLAEIDHGPDEGAAEAAVVARIGRAALAAWDEAGVPPPGWIVDAGSRLAAWRDFLARPSGDALLVTSNGAARFALLATGLAPVSLKLATGAYGEIVVTAGAASLAAWNVRPPVGTGAQ